MAASFKRSVGVLAVLASVGAGALAGCSSSSSPKAATSGSSAAVQVPAGALIKAGQLTVCSDITSPPLTYFDASQKVVGAEADLGAALADQMGLSVKWANTAFNGIIPALQAKQCDAIMSQLYIKPAREKVVDFVPYMYASNTLVVQNKDGGISGPADLCGKKAAAETGTTAAQYLQDQSTSECTKVGKPKIDIRLFTKDSDALQQLKIGLVDSYGTTLETAAYVIKQQPNTFKTVGQPFGRIKVGLATAKSDQALHTAVGEALAAVQKNGQYAAILKKWNLAGDSISAG
jgi:polar amino acid transport system substrate-binding protein